MNEVIEEDFQVGILDDKKNVNKKWELKKIFDAIFFQYLFVFYLFFHYQFCSKKKFKKNKLRIVVVCSILNSQ